MCSQTEHHYDANARIQSPQTPLRQFHNDAKRALLEMHAKGADMLLDLACGRGGDIHKWSQLNVRAATCMDISKESIQEARARYNKIKKKCQCTFHQVDLAQGIVPVTGHYDVVTCMFALHYFFSSEATARKFMHLVSSSLMPGGRFLGIVPDALQINECIKYGIFDNGIMRVEAQWTGEPQCFGSAYTCSIRDTITGDSSVPEYLVYGSVLTQLASMYGLRPLPITSPIFAAAEHGLHRLVPRHAGSLGQCSSIYGAFAFEKIGSIG